MNKLYTAQEVADRLQIKKTTAYELIKRGELYSSKVGKQLRISEQQLNQYLEHSNSGNPGNSAMSSLQVPEFPPESSLLKRDYLLHSSGLILCGQFSPALELLVSQMSIHPQGIPHLEKHCTGLALSSCTLCQGYRNHMQEWSFAHLFPFE